MYYGANRSQYDQDLLKSADVVVTSYGMIASEYRQQMLKNNFNDITDKKKRSKSANLSSVLLGMMWNRVVLDEAHNIKNHDTVVAGASFALSLLAARRWVLTGTPIQVWKHRENDY
jgi:SNF2 family DNA or RNA helicase